MSDRYVSSLSYLQITIICQTRMCYHCHNSRAASYVRQICVITVLTADHHHMSQTGMRYHCLYCRSPSCHRLVCVITVLAAEQHHMSQTGMCYHRNAAKDINGYSIRSNCHSNLQCRSTYYKTTPCILFSLFLFASRTLSR